MSEGYDDPSDKSRPFFRILVTKIELNKKQGKVWAWADLCEQTEMGNQALNGFSVYGKGDGLPNVGFPSKPPATKGGRWFPVVECDGKLRELIVAAVLAAYQELISKD